MGKNLHHLVTSIFFFSASHSSRQVRNTLGKRCDFCGEVGEVAPVSLSLWKPSTGRGFSKISTNKWEAVGTVQGHERWYFAENGFLVLLQGLHCRAVKYSLESCKFQQ